GSKTELSAGFVDDVMFLAITKSLTEMHAILKDLLERAQGTFKWFLSHNSSFELSKLALMNFLRLHCDAIPTNLTLHRTDPGASITAQTVNTVITYKYLGLMFDTKLKWAAQTHWVIATAVWWMHQIARLSQVSGGMPLH
ncbi:hypothetical protein C0993_001989, partial [Termitomyces sp. T159_Od127]